MASLRKKVYSVDESYHEKMPDNRQIGLYEDVIDYCKKVISIIKGDLLKPQSIRRYDNPCM